MNEIDWRDFFLSLDNTLEDDETEPEVRLFRVGDEAAIFASIEKSSKPLRISLRCDKRLAKNLRDKYETVLPARRFDSRVWNTVILTGQLDDEEIKDLARLSYSLTLGR